VSVSKGREIQNPQQQSGTSNPGVFLVVLAVMVCVWFGMARLQTRTSAPQQATSAAHTVAIAAGGPSGTSGVAAAATGGGFGKWGVVAKPMLFLLSWVHAHVVSNWGWAIVILTGMINVVLWPTRVMSLRSTLKMQRIQPQMNAIKLRYKEFSLTDPRRQEMQREVMELQKSEGASMFGGCLPMLIPWPLMVGFYKMLAGAEALRGASWLWLHDLAAADPHHVLPVLVVLTMAASQLLTPMPGVDAKQQRVMALAMPVIFGVFAWKYAAGLALYFVCSNVFGGLQQMVMNRTAVGREIREIAARRP
jgi:YidC/Oxa1 family membrane protein insertase